jgi:hypothetical protein
MEGGGGLLRLLPFPLPRSAEEGGGGLLEAALRIPVMDPTVSLIPCQISFTLLDCLSIPLLLALALASEEEFRDRRNISADVPGAETMELFDPDGRSCCLSIAPDGGK